MVQTTIKELKKGEFFTFKEIENPEERQIWIRGEYERSEKKYSCYKFSDINHETFKKGTTKVWVGFTF